MGVISENAEIAIILIPDHLFRWKMIQSDLAWIFRYKSEKWVCELIICNINTKLQGKNECFHLLNEFK